ncbi:hypothetical protein ACQPU1_09140 [Clostridium paraputrificum]|uniref:hypothetical protein n=1 Tax=Clostridium TaxID=1485 RepID=UPI003D347A9E
MKLSSNDEVFDATDLKTKSNLYELLVNTIFSPKFMIHFSNFTSLDDLLRSGNYTINSLKDFEEINQEDFNDYISKTTKFGSWNHMLHTAKLALVKSILDL